MADLTVKDLCHSDSQPFPNLTFDADLTVKDLCQSDSQPFPNLTFEADLTVKDLCSSDSVKARKIIALEADLKVKDLCRGEPEPVQKLMFVADLTGKDLCQIDSVKAREIPVLEADPTVNDPCQHKPQKLSGVTSKADLMVRDLCQESCLNFSKNVLNNVNLELVADLEVKDLCSSVSHKLNPSAEEFVPDGLYVRTQSRKLNIINNHSANFWSNSHMLRCNICKSLGTVSFKADLEQLISLHERIWESQLPNYLGCRIPVPSKLNILFWRNELEGFHDKELCELLEYGFPIGIINDNSVLQDMHSTCKNHLGASQFSSAVLQYLQEETSGGAVVGPFKLNPFSHNIVISPLNTVAKKDTSERRVILDLSWPVGKGVNSHIPKDSYLGVETSLRFPTVDSLVEIVKRKGSGCLMFKKDLKRAYRQLPVDPKDWNCLGYKWKGHIFLDMALPMGLRSACLCCQRTTDGVRYICHSRKCEIVNYIDDFAGAEVPELADQAFQILEEVLSHCGLVESSSKSVSPSTVIIFLGVLLNSITMTLQITQDRLEEILHLLDTWTHKVMADKTEVQSLVGKLVFVASCVKPGRIFISRMLNFLRVMPEKMSVELPTEFFKDVIWWPIFNGISMMWHENFLEPDIIASSDACLTGSGGLCGTEFFHKQFPSYILVQSLDINSLELLSIIVCAKLWGKLWKGKVVCFF